MTHATSGMRAALAAMAAAALLAGACGGDGKTKDPTPDAAATVAAAGAADRPDWFPAAFPLPANTTVVSETPDGSGGGGVTFHAPVPFVRTLQALDLNLDSHGFTVTDRQESENEATYVFESLKFTGTAKLTGQELESTLDVVLKAK